MRTLLRLAALLAVFVANATYSAAAQDTSTSGYFAIHVVDADTGGGVPLVELRTTNEISLFTDSNGYVAFNEPGLMDSEVFFFVKSDGYSLEPPDGFGYRGVRLVPRAGAGAEIKLQRHNIAERLYRITGAGIYHDSVLLGKPVPTRQPLINGRVMGQDSVQSVVYRGKIFWLWGDTGRPEYPLGNFACAAAVSELPASGGLAPSVGVDLEYFTGPNGFAKEMARGIGERLVWLDAFMVLPDPQGRERLLAKFARLESMSEKLEQGLCIYDDETSTFVREATWPLDAVEPVGQPFRVTVDGAGFYYFPTPYPQLRVRATWEDVHDTTRYEAWTCLAPGSRYEKDKAAIERDADGRAVWAWKRDTAYLTAAQVIELTKSGQLRAEDRWNVTRDAETGDEIILWGGSVAWNAYRQRYIMIASQGFGKPSFLGEIYYADAARPEGPWPLARKIITHEKHSFYNPVSHPFLDEDGGRVIYLEGTYVDTFSGGAIPTPRYNYNQVMYRLDLGDERLKAALIP